MPYICTNVQYQCDLDVTQEPVTKINIIVGQTVRVKMWANLRELIQFSGTNSYFCPIEHKETYA